MKIAIAVAVGLVLLGLVWSPNILQSTLNHSFPPVTPTVSTPGTGIANTVPDQYRIPYGAFFRDLAVITKADTDIKTTGQLLIGAQYAVHMLKNADNLPDDPTFSAAVKDRFTTSVGTGDKTLDSDTRNKFADTCNQIAAELGVK